MLRAILEIIQAVVVWLFDLDRLKRERKAKIADLKAQIREAIALGDMVRASQLHAELLRLLREQQAHHPDGK